MCLKAIIAHYHAVLLCPHVRTALIWNFDLHVNVVNFHIIKIHKSNTIGRPGIRARARVCVHEGLLQECIQVCLYMHMQLHFYIYVRACMQEYAICKCVRVHVCVCVCVCVHACICVCGDRGGFGVEIMH